MLNPIFSQDGLYQIFRWFHFMAGITWIGLLYYFNFVQGPFFGETDAQTKSSATRQLVPRALWWFRWSAALTWLMGVLMLGYEAHLHTMAVYSSTWGVWILIGAVLGTLMAANVWFIIWPNQKIVIASANAVASGGTANPQAAQRGARGGVASRTNVLFSIPMLFLMGASRHLPISTRDGVPYQPFTNHSPWLLVLVMAILIGALELNAIVGKTGPMTTIKGVIHSGLGLTVVIYLAVCLTI